MIRGAVYQIDLEQPRGHEQGGRRYGVVLSPTDMPWSVATIVPTSTMAQVAVFRPEIEVDGDTTRVLIDQIRTVDTDYIRGEPVYYLARDQLAEIEHALTHYIGLVLTTDD